jgi:hypothetical protein
MRTRWFADPAEGERLDETLLQLVGAVSRMLDFLASPPVAPGTGRIDAAASAVVLPHAGVPGCSLVVQVVAWSASVGCWWSVGTDPRTGPVSLELSAELPLEPDGPARAAAWLERELERPVVARVRRYGVARRQEWAVVLDDGYELAVGHRWRPGPGEGGTVPGWTVLTGWLPDPRSWLLGLAVAAALSRWALAALTLQLLGPTWAGPAARALALAAAAALLAWFRDAGRPRPGQVRVPMLAGLLLATLGAGLAFLLGPAEWAPPVESVPRALELFLRDESPNLLGLAALACYLSALRGLPGRAAPRPPWPRVLPAAAGLAWGLDLAVGLYWLARFEPAPGEAVLTWYGALVLAMRATAVGLALVLVLVVLDRRPGLSRPAAQDGLAGAVLLALAWSLAVQVAAGWLVPHLPQVLAPGLFAAPVVLGGFAGTALLAVAAADPQASSDGSSRPTVATVR